MRPAITYRSARRNVGAPNLPDRKVRIQLKTGGTKDVFIPAATPVYRPRLTMRDGRHVNFARAEVA